MLRTPVCFLLKRHFHLPNTRPETLTGLSIIRAYRSQVMFTIILDFLSPRPILLQEHALKGADQGMDMENRAYYMTISIQRWLTVRLDFLGNILVFGIALFATGFRHSVNPSKTGVVLSYALASEYFFRYIPSNTLLKLFGSHAGLLCGFFLRPLFQVIC